MTEEAILEVDKDSVRKGLIKYTRKAFHMVPELDRPYILDIGCGLWLSPSLTRRR